MVTLLVVFLFLTIRGVGLRDDSALEQKSTSPFEADSL
jgi:hypothetical protein